MTVISNHPALPMTTDWLSRLAPRTALALVGVVLVVCVFSGATLAIYPKWLEHHREKSGWLPDSADVVEVQAFVKEEEFREWVPKELPPDTVPAILELLSRRKLPEEVLPKRTKGQPFRLVTFDYKPILSLDLKVTRTERPVRVHLCRSGTLWVGDRLFYVHRDDSAALEKLVLDHYYADLRSP